MKQAIVGFGFFMMLILTVGCVMAIEKDSIELQKLEESVEVSIYQSLNEAITLEEDPGELFKRNLTATIGEGVSVTVLAADYKKGILSVSVEKAYTNFGKSRSVCTERTVIYEREV